jgi:hypothetical protein
MTGDQNEENSNTGGQNNTNFCNQNTRENQMGKTDSLETIENNDVEMNR